MSYGDYDEFKALELEVALSEADAVRDIRDSLWCERVRRYFDLAQDTFLLFPSAENSEAMASVSAAFQRAFAAAPIADALYTEGFSLDMSDACVSSRALASV